MSLHVYLYEKPVTPVPIATFSSASSTGVLSSTNQYQVNIKVDPNNTDRRAITCKTLVNETDAYVLVTTNGGSSWTALAVGSNTGDPDCVWDNSGNLYVSYIDIADSYKTKIKKLSSPYTTLGSAVHVGSSVDHPVIQIIRSGTYAGRLIVAGRNHAGGNLYISRSDDGASWSTINFAGPTSTCIDQFLDVSPAGTVLMGVGAASGGNWNAYVYRSTDGAASFGSSILIGAQNQTLPGGYTDCSRLGFGSGGKIIWAGAMTVNSKPGLGIRTSTDDGQTWSSQTAVAEPVTSFGIGQCSVAMNSSGYGAILYFEQDNSLYPLRAFDLTGNFRVKAITTLDNGNTWSSPQEVSTQLTPWGWNGPQIRDPGKDQTVIDIVGNTIYLGWSEGSSSSLYTTQTRTITFS